jgi:membrane-associated HD superfamily phosphohydrolase
MIINPSDCDVINSLLYWGLHMYREGEALSMKQGKMEQTVRQLRKELKDRDKKEEDAKKEAEGKDAHLNSTLELLRKTKADLQQLQEEHNELSKRHHGEPVPITIQPFVVSIILTSQMVGMDRFTKSSESCS